MSHHKDQHGLHYDKCGNCDCIKENCQDCGRGRHMFRMSCEERELMSLNTMLVQCIRNNIKWVNENKTIDINDKDDVMLALIRGTLGEPHAS